jgi:agmatine deiminase
MTDASAAIPAAIPAEWAPHAAIWTAWPSAADLWEADLEPARSEVSAMVRALAGGGDRMRVLAHGMEAEQSARAALGDAAVVIAAPFGDIWLRDTGPIFARGGLAHAFRFNGWGGKYVLDHDDAVAARIAEASSVRLVAHDFILEGGAIEMDGEGTLLTTRQCLLNPNRNPGWTQDRAEEALRRALGIEKVLWLDDGLANDHTDGHIDNLARFVGPGRVVCQSPSGADDPNAAVLDSIADALEAMTDARGRRLEIVRIPSPGLVLDEDGDPIPASHMNFVIGNGCVPVPIYSATGDDAVRALAPLFPGRTLIGLSANAILTGGGAFHCITQQQPA